MFRGKTMPRSARQAAKANGLSTVGSYEVVCHYRAINEDDPGFDKVVIRAYSPSGGKSVDITAGDVYYYESVLQDAPMARV